MYHRHRGYATPTGAAAVVRFVAAVAEDCGAEVGIDWHGHRDRGMAMINAITALEAGATRLHGTALGIGERVGNTPIDLLLVNLVLMGYLERDLTRLNEYCAVVSRACDLPIPPNYPVIGKDAFRTTTGVHAAAVIKALRNKDPTPGGRHLLGHPGAAGRPGARDSSRSDVRSVERNILAETATVAGLRFARRQNPC